MDTFASGRGLPFSGRRRAKMCTPALTHPLTLKNQTQYEFSTAGKLTRIHEPAGNQLLR